MTIITERPLLGPMQKRLWDVLCASKGSLVTWEDLVIALYTVDDQYSRRATAKIVHFVRQSLGDEAIITVRNRGYRMGKPKFPKGVLV